MPNFNAQSAAALSTCHPKLQLIASEVIRYVEFRVLQGHRGKEEQEAAFKAGNTKLHFPFGNHNSFPSRAMDVVPISSQPGDALSWKDVAAFARLGGYIQACADRHAIKLRFGFDWDGDWRTVGLDPDEKFLDAPHVELAASEV